MFRFSEYRLAALAFALTAVSAMAGKEADTALLEACERGDAAAVAKALKDGANPNASGAWRKAPALQVALGEGKAEIVKLLAEAGADFQLKAEDGETALHAAADAGCDVPFQDREGVIRNLRLVLGHGLAVNARDHAGREPLEIAARECAETVRILLRNGAVASPQALEAAMKCGKRDCAKLLMAAGADPKAVLPDGRTMFHALGEVSGFSAEDRDDTVWLLNLVAGRGVPVDSRDSEGRTPLLLAAGTRGSCSIDWLLAHGADAAAVDHSGVTALMRAAEGEEAWRNDVAARLIDSGCPPDAVDQKGLSTLDRLQASNNWAGIMLLLRNGAQARNPPELLRTALMTWREIPAEPAAMRHIAGLLLPTAIRDPGFRIGDRPLLSELVFLGDPYLLDLALRKGAEPDASDGSGRTALMWAAAVRNGEMETMLRQAGADPALKDQSGRTALDWAALAGAKLNTGTPPKDEAEASGGETENGSALQDAVAGQRMERVRQLLAGGKPVVPGLLSLAAHTGNVEIAGMLLAYGAKVDDRDENGNSPAHIAALEWRRELMDLLLLAGADLSLRNKEGRSVINEAVEAGYREWAGDLARRVKAPDGRPEK